jgi:hypothetical protein
LPGAARVSARSREDEPRAALAVVICATAGAAASVATLSRMDTVDRRAG